MNTKNFSDYYPVYKDLSDQMKTNTSARNIGVTDHKKNLLTDMQNSETGFSESSAMLNARELTDTSLKLGFSPFQIIILLIKNAFEGHVFLTWQIRPGQLFEKGSFLFQSGPESMIHSFYKNFEKYRPGLNQVWNLLQEKVHGITGISFDLMVHTIVVNNLIRPPVSLVSLYDIRSFSDTLPTNQQAMDHSFKMVLLGEAALAEHEFIQRVNIIYEEKYKKFVHQLSLKEGVFSHYQRKLALSLSPEIKTEEELDDLMYKKLVEEQVNRKYPDSDKYVAGIQLSPETPESTLKFVNKTKAFYRSVSKNCSEIHSAADGESCFPELNSIFLKANSIYNQTVSNLSESLLQFMRMLLLLSEVVIFRKSKGYKISDNLQLIADFNSKQVLPDEELKLLHRNMDTILIDYRQKCFTDYKMKFVMDDDFTDLHNHFLQKQLEYIDQQIIQIQKDIKEVLKLKTDIPISKKDKKQ
jgi:hypothetical protein